MQPEDLNRWYVRNAQGGMVPFSAFGHGEWTYGPQKLTRFNGVPAFQIQGAPAPGHSSGEAMNAMEEIVAKLPAGVGLEWNGLSYEEKKSGSQAPLLYALSLAIVFLCLAALYESWSIPDDGAAGGAAGRGGRGASPPWRAASPTTRISRSACW